MKKKLQKKGENVLWVLKKALPLHPLSERKPLEKSSLKDLDINKQVVQKAYLGKKTETVNNFNKLEIDLVLEQIKTSSNEET
ncbi:MAG: hypothetical protein IJA95_10895 [Bacteroidaceae bacterium]|nr:hypothetical protein [Bacteroidaceae bacterium]